MYGIHAVWETPSHEDSYAYTLGERVHGEKWTVGRIEEDRTGFGVEGMYTEIHVYDRNDEVRVTFPKWAVAVSRRPDEGDD